MRRGTQEKTEWGSRPRTSGRERMWWGMVSFEGFHFLGESGSKVFSEMGLGKEALEIFRERRKCKMIP